MKLLHISDLHLGRQLGERELLEDQQAMLKQVVQLAQDHAVDGVLVAGDVYDRSLPSAQAVVLWDDFLTGLAGAKIPVYIISGNHDAAERLAFAGRLLDSQGIHLASVFQGKPAFYELTDEFGTVNLWLLPFFRLAAARQFFADEKLEDMNAAARAVLGAAKIDSTRRNLLVAHQFVTAGTAEPQRSDSESVTVGTLDAIDAGVFEAFDYVALGHIHGPQRVGCDTVRYSGSPLKYSASEDIQRKCALLVTLGQKGEVQVEELPIRPLRDLRTVTGSIEELLAAAEPSDDYLRVRLTDPGVVADAANRLRAVFPNLFKIEFVAPKAGSTGVARVADLRRKTQRQLFEEFYETIHHEPPEEALRALMEELIGKEDEV